MNVWALGARLSKVAKPSRFNAITFDTQTVMHNSFNFSGGLLAQLKQFVGSPIQVAVSEVVAREIHSRLVDRTAEAHARLRAARRDARELGLMAALPDEEAVQDINAIAKARLDRFLEEIGAVVVPTLGAPISAILNRYFARQPPFSSKKKDEFPDAIALLSLQRWAREQGALLVVSGDKDWKEFANESPYMGHVTALGEALQHFQPHLTETAKLAVRLLNRIAQGPDLELPQLFWDAFSDEVTSQDLSIRAWHDDFDVVAESAEIVPRRSTTFIDTSSLRVVSEARNRLVVEVPVAFQADLEAELEFLAGPAKIGGMTLTTEAYVQGNFLLHLIGDFSVERVDEVRVETLSRPLGVRVGLVHPSSSDLIA